jgi:hypothetical protein
VTRQITPEILQRALDQERRGETRPRRSVLRQILARLEARGIALTIVRCVRVR